ncbi:MAG: porin family protein [Bacteroidales bacterium]|nr:porin family protein [Bacteroidales bacterium]MCF8327356.1 porin family protein [Bacteroidales bacterium]
MRSGLILLLLLMMFKPGFSQWGGYHQFASDWELNPNIGMTSFYGDLSDKKNRFFSNTPFHKYFYQDRGLAYGAVLKKNFTPSFSVRGSFLHGRINSGSDQYGLYFESTFNEYYLGAEFDVSNLIWGERRNRDWTLYGFLGIGFTDSRTWQYDDETDELVDRDGFGEERWFDDKEKMATSTTIPFGLGVSYQIDEKWELNFETGIHGMNTDRLDAFASGDASTEGLGYTSLGFSYHFHLPWNVSFRRYPKYNGKSSDPAISKYNKRKRVVMKTKAHRRASRKRYKHYSDKNFFERLWESIKGLFKRKHYIRR